MLIKKWTANFADYARLYHTFSYPYVIFAAVKINITIMHIKTIIIPVSFNACIYEPVAAAIGIGLDVLSPDASMVVHIGSDTCEVAVLALGGIVASRSIQIAGALDHSISEIEAAILSVLKSTPPESSNDIYENGIYLSGGGALLRGLDKRISEAMHLPVHIADDPLNAVARGTEMALKDFDQFPFIVKYVKK